MNIMNLERAEGIEPSCLTWKDSALPLSYARKHMRELQPELRNRKLFFRENEKNILSDSEPVGAGKADKKNIIGIINPSDDQ